RLTPAAERLLSALRGVCRLGFVATVRAGDTGIGATLEHLLGIKANSRRTPDYDGIELKASRRVTRGPNRVNLFSQVPDWKNSAVNARQLLENYGYVRNGRRQLYCTVDATPNAQG